jgi:predicted metal-dependent HD superfamily phosphohydrolase
MQENFLEAVAQDHPDVGKAQALWLEIRTAYTNPARYYHTLTHLDNMITQLVPYRHMFANWYTLTLAIAYHDAVYDPQENNNEEKSAELAASRLKEINFPETERTRCIQFILATKKHERADSETNIFTDADLSILGAEPEAYTLYTQQIRKEYGMYPDFLYKPGRKIVLQHFLSMDTIYKTEAFKSAYEARAKVNLKHELEMLDR